MFCPCPGPVTTDQETGLALQETTVQGATDRTAIVEIVLGAIGIHLPVPEQTGRRPLS